MHKYLCRNKPQRAPMCVNNPTTRVAVGNAMHFVYGRVLISAACGFIGRGSRFKK